MSRNYSVLDYTNLKCPNCLVDVDNHNVEFCPLCNIQFNLSFMPEQLTTFNKLQFDDDEDVIQVKGKKTETKYTSLSDEQIYGAEDWDRDDLDPIVIDTNVVMNSYAYLIMNDVSMTPVGNADRLTNHIDEERMMCCGKDKVLCDCDGSYNFDDAVILAGSVLDFEKQDQGNAEWLAYEAYVLHDKSNNVSLCESCELYASYECKPFRNWLRMVLDTDVAGVTSDLRVVDLCNDFDPDVDAPIEVLDAAYAKLEVNDNVINIHDGAIEIVENSYLSGQTDYESDFEDPSSYYFE